MSDAAPRPRPSATVVLVRQGESKPQVLMVKRHARTAFGAAYAFPGGVLEPCDRLVYGQCLHTEPAAADRILHLRGNGLEYFSAAVRELFEEAGVLLAETKHSDELPDVRQRLNAGELLWSQAVREYGFGLQCDQLHYFAHWITPLTEPRRFSTRFFLAMLPAGQVAKHDGAELTDSRWMTAEDVLQAAKSGDMQLIYPTCSTLKEIRHFDTPEEIVGWANTHAEKGVEEVMPAIIDSDARKTVVMPGDPRYPAGVVQ